MSEFAKVTRRGIFALTAAVAGIALTAPAKAQVSFAGETVEWIIPFSTGGGSDTWARFNAPFLQKHLPGNPEVVVVNEPRWRFHAWRQPVHRNAPNLMVLTVLGTSGSTQFPYLPGRSARALRIPGLGSGDGPRRPAESVYTTPETGVESVDDIADLEGQRLVYAARAPRRSIWCRCSPFDLLGLDVQYVFGFRGRG